MKPPFSCKPASLRATATVSYTHLEVYKRQRLYLSLAVLGALEPLQQDAAGKVLLDLLEARRVELGGNAALFNFAAWRDWLNRELSLIHI